MAGLIPQSFIDELLARADIVEVIDKRVALKKSGKNYSACCPFHNEKTPSFSVQPEKQFYYCFGCGATGNAIRFIMEFEQLEFPQAVEALARDNGMDVPREQSKTELRRQSEHAKLIDMLERASKYYQLQLRQHAQRDEAVGYLKSRGLSGEVARDFAIGYAPPGWDNLLNELGEDENAQHVMFRAGMLIERDRDKQQGGRSSQEQRSPYYDRFRQRIMFPIRDSRGRTIAFGGRVLGDDKPKYLNSPETPVFHKGSELYGLYEARKSNQRFDHFLLVEGYMDVIALAQAGIHNAVATLGTATSGRHLERLFRQVAEVIFCFDGDQAGRTAAWRAMEATLPQMQDGRQVKFLFLPEGEDPDTLVRQIGAEGFKERVRSATPLADYFFEHLAEELDMDSLEGKARLSNLAKPLLGQLPRGVYRQLMLERLTSILGITGTAVEDLIPEPAATAAPEPGAYPPDMPADMPPPAPDDGHGFGSSRSAAPRGPGYSRPTRQASVQRPAAVKAIELLLRNPEVALRLESDLKPLEQAGDEYRKLLLSLIELVREDPHIDRYRLIGHCYATPLGAQLTGDTGHEDITPIEGVEGEFIQIVDNILSDIRHKLHKLELKQKLKLVSSGGKPVPSPEDDRDDESVRGAVVSGKEAADPGPDPENQSG